MDRLSFPPRSSPSSSIPSRGKVPDRALAIPFASPAGQFTYGYLPNSNPVHTVTNTREPNRDVLASKENKISSTNTVVSRFDYSVNRLNQRTSVKTSYDDQSRRVARHKR